MVVLRKVWISSFAGFAANVPPGRRVEAPPELVADSTAAAPFVMLPADREGARADRSVEGGD